MQLLSACGVRERVDAIFDSVRVRIRVRVRVRVTFGVRVRVTVRGGVTSYDFTLHFL